MNKLTDHLRVCILPLEIVQDDKAANLHAVETAFHKLPEKTDIVVLPELFSTGFISDNEKINELAEKNTGFTIDFLKKLAARYSTAIAGSFLAHTHPHFYNRAFFIEPNGDETFYDKRHLFSVSQEAQVLAPGKLKSKIIRFRGWNISMIICYDLRFPVWTRTVGKNYDILLVPANWPKSRKYAWEHLLIARAIENQCSVVGADRGGTDKYGQYDDMSFIFNHMGEPVGYQAECSPFICADLSKDLQEEYRSSFPAWTDADDFQILQP